MLCIPWSRPRTLRALLGVNTSSVRETRSVCKRLVKQGWAQSADWPAWRARLFAPTDEGVLHAAEELRFDSGKLRNFLQLSRTRFWQLRAAQAVLQPLAVVMEQFARAEYVHYRAKRVVWQCMARRLISDIPIHMRVAVHRPERICLFHVVADWDIDERPDRIMPVLANLRKAIEGANGRFPAIVLLTRSESHVAPLIELADRAEIGPWTFVSPGLQPEDTRSLHQHGWHWRQYSEKRLEHPYEGFTLSQEQYRNSSLVVPDPLDLKLPRGVPEQARYNLRMDAGWQSLSEKMEPLTHDALRVMRTLARYPAIDKGTMSTFTSLSLSDVDEAYEQLATADLATRYDDLLALTPLGARTFAVHEGLDAEGEHQRYEQFLSQRLHVRAHTKAAAAFPADIRQHAAALNRTTLIQTIGPRGRISLVTYRDEMLCRTTTPSRTEMIESGAGSDFFFAQPIPALDSEWAPDGFVEVAVGKQRTGAWYEISGTEQSTSKSDRQKWFTKLDAYQGYQMSKLWRTLYDKFPRLLIVFAVKEIETFNRRLNLIEDLLYELQTRGYPSIKDVQVYATTQSFLKAHGPLGKIWFDCRYGVSSTPQEDVRFAFDGLPELGIETEMPALISA